MQRYNFFLVICWFENRKLLKTLFSHFRHCGLDLQSHVNKAFNKWMLKQVQHDEEFLGVPNRKKAARLNSL